MPYIYIYISVELAVIPGRSELSGALGVFHLHTPRPGNSVGCTSWQKQPRFCSQTKPFPARGSGLLPKMLGVEVKVQDSLSHSRLKAVATISSARPKFGLPHGKLA
jgi:hypothetical protein